MPNEDPATIEQRLRAYAEERRAQLDRSFEMPPGTRQFLRSELARRRQGAAPDPAGAPGWWKVFWPYVALGSSALAAAAICVVVWWQDFRPASSRAYAAKEKSESGQLPALMTDEAVAQTNALARPADETPDSAPPTTLKADKDTADEAVGRLTERLPAVAVEAKKEAESAPVLPSPATPEPRPKPKVKRADAAAVGELVMPSAPAQAGKAVKAVGNAPSPRRDQAPPASDELRLGSTLRYAVAPQGGVAEADKRAKEPSPDLGVPQETKGVLSSGRSLGLARSAPAAAPAPQALPPSTALAAKPAAVPEPAASPTVAAVPLLRQEAARQVLAPAAGGLPFSNQNNWSYQQRFVRDTSRAYRRNFNSPPRPEVLESFRVEQAGARLLITDADGSVYSGDLQEANTVGREARPQSSVGSSLAEVLRNQAANLGVEAANELRFQVAGTNRTLQQPVVFSGRLVLTNALAAGQYFQNQQAAGSNAFGFFLNNSVVRGRAAIGQRTQMEVNAAPASP